MDEIENKITFRTIKYLIHQKYYLSNNLNSVSVSEVRNYIENKLQLPTNSLKCYKKEIKGFLKEYQDLENNLNSSTTSGSKRGKWSQEETRKLIEVVKEYAAGNNYELADILPNLRAEDYSKKKIKHKGLWQYATSVIPGRSERVIILIRIYFFIF